MPRPPSKPDPLAEIAAVFPDFEDDAEAQLSLRAQALADPPMGAPILVGEGEQEEPIEPGRWEDHGYVDRRTGLPPNCPVKPLGKLGDLFFFLNTLGEVHVLQANAGKGHIDALFAGRPNWLVWAWPRRSAKGFIVNWEAEQARQDLFAACAYKGAFELEDRVRGRGAWRGDDGSLIYHAGDAVFYDGKWRPPGEYGYYIYPGRPRIGRPSERYQASGDGSPGDLLLQALQSWKWERGELDARLCLGWLITAMIGGALAQRPVAYVVGQEGTGKSTLQALLRHVLNGALLSTSNTTQAGIYQRVKEDSVAVMIDELEAKEDTRTTDRIIELARISYTGDKMQRGGQNGVGKEFAVMSSFLFSMIALPTMGAQDLSRSVILHMRERDKPQPGEAAVDVLRELGLREAKLARATGAHLLRRAFRWFPKWDELRGAYREALIGAGHEDRSADTFGALAAGCHVALSDELPDKATLDQWAAWLDPDRLAETANREKTWRACFTHMLAAQPEVLKTWSQQTRSIGDAVKRFRESAANIEDVQAVLRVNGMALSFPRNELEEFATARLFVPAKHPALHALFEGTPWAGRLGAPGPWGPVLRQMPRDLWENGKCDKGLDKKASGLLINLAQALEA